MTVAKINDVLEHLRADADVITTKFARASTSGRNTPQEVADLREPVVQNFVQKFFPFPYRVTKGKIRDSFGNLSASVDCVLCNPVHPHTVENNDGKFQLIFADGVDAAIEIKPDLSRSSELLKALEQSVSVKRLSRARRISMTIRPGDDGERMNAHGRRIASFIYTMKCKARLMETFAEIADYYAKKKVDVLDQFDAVVVHGSGILVNYKIPGDYIWRGDGFGRTGWIFEEWGPDTLAGFLTHLNNVWPCVNLPAPAVMPHYLNGAMPTLYDVSEGLQNYAAARKPRRPRKTSSAKRRARRP